VIRADNRADEYLPETQPEVLSQPSGIKLRIPALQDRISSRSQSPAVSEGLFSSSIDLLDVKPRPRKEPTPQPPAAEDPDDEPAIPGLMWLTKRNGYNP
jgi:hypothetical protein